MEGSFSLWDFSDGISLPGGIFILLVLIMLVFVLRFMLPAFWLLRNLRQVNKALERQKKAHPETIAKEVMKAPLLAHLWREYAQTLHEVKTVQNHGQITQSWRAASSAGQFFTVTSLLETPLKTEFYKHLPGILTGIGIIGTFAGLITGLTHFEVNSDTDTVRLSLKHLIQGVGHAFQISALAITLAMLSTWIEKSLVMLGHRQIARLNERIDSLFEGGIEEEYLVRLVEASEVSAEQAKQWPRLLSEELRRYLEDFSKNQQEQMGKTIANAVSMAVGQALRDPLARVAAAVEKAGGAQGESIGQSLAPLLERFATRMESSLGKGQAGLETLLEHAAKSLNHAGAELAKTAARLDQMGQGAVTKAAGQLQTAGQGVGRVADNFAQACEQLQTLAGPLSLAVREAAEIMREQTQTRQAFAMMLDDAKQALESARREALLTTELVARLESAGSALGRAELEAGHYLEGINKVLTGAHASFAENVERTLRQGNAQFHKELALAVDYLKGAIESLGDTLEILASRR